MPRRTQTPPAPSQPGRSSGRTRDAVVKTIIPKWIDIVDAVNAPPDSGRDARHGRWVEATQDQAPYMRTVAVDVVVVEDRKLEEGEERLSRQGSGESMCNDVTVPALCK